MTVAIVGFEVLGVDHQVADLVVWTIGWLLGWALLARPIDITDRVLGTTAAATDRPAVAVVVPARDEEENLAALVPAVVGRLRRGDRLVVVDDGSTDRTASVAAELGADVVTVSGPPPGWAGKPHACHVGAAASDQPVLVFLDADVRPSPTLLDDVGHAVARDPSRLVSVQPWHDMPTARERVSALVNVIALMGSGAFTAIGRRAGATMAFGPVIAVDRATYDAAGGHGSPEVRSATVEDLALARRIGRVSLHAGQRSTTRFRMYPTGIRQAVAGWTRSLSGGIGATPWWAAVGIVAWAASLVGGPIAVPVVTPLVVAQVWVLGRRAGRVGPFTALAFPVLVVFLVVVSIRAVALRLVGGTVPWRGRAVPADDRRR